MFLESTTTQQKKTPGLQWPTPPRRTAMTPTVRKHDLFRTQIEGYIEKTLPQAEAALHLLAPIQDAVLSPGKRLRPTLLMLTCDALGGSVEEALPAAAAIELMHNFTLVHDDIIDQDDMRRGRPTIRKKWGDHLALLTGDRLLAMAYQSLLKSPPSRLAPLARCFTDTVLQICDGQALDYDFERRDDVGLADYLDMIARKTACLFAACAEMGALLASATAAPVKIMRRFGEQLGLGFQIQDDLLDITVSQNILGKDFGSDVRRRKRTFLYLHVMTHGAPAHCESLQKLFRKSEIAPADILIAQRIFYEAGAVAAAEAAVHQRLQEARSCLRELGAAALTSALSELVETIARRNM